VTGPGEVDRDKKGEGLREDFVSLAPSTRRGIAGEGGLLVAEELLLPDALFSTSSKGPSFCVFLADGWASGDILPDGVPNWSRISLRLGHLAWMWRLRTYKAKLLDQLVVLRGLEVGLLRRQGVRSGAGDSRASRLSLGSLGWTVEVAIVRVVRSVNLETTAVA